MREVVTLTIAVKSKRIDSRPVDCPHIESLGKNGNGKTEWYCALLADTWEDEQPEIMRKEGCYKKGCYLFGRFMDRARRIWGKNFSL